MIFQKKSNELKGLVPRKLIPLYKPKISNKSVLGHAHDVCTHRPLFDAQLDFIEAFYYQVLG